MEGMVGLDLAHETRDVSGPDTKRDAVVGTRLYIRNESRRACRTKGIHTGWDTRHEGSICTWHGNHWEEYLYDFTKTAHWCMGGTLVHGRRIIGWIGWKIPFSMDGRKIPFGLERRAARLAWIEDIPHCMDEKEAFKR